MTCSVCGQLLPEEARFCPNCGAPVATPLATDERKMVTVVFVDLVDSTGLARRYDAERAREILGRFFAVANEELLALRGRPEKFIGDAVMAVFGLPTVHEDDALRAVRAGLAIRGRLHRLTDNLGVPEPLEVHVGIESGEAATGLGPAGQVLVTGPVVNAAARLQDAARPGEVLVGRTTFALTNAAVTYGERRDVAAKGFDADLAAFPATGLSTRSKRRTIPFVGRASELTILRESLARVASTARPMLVTVLGEPGIGKSRLADELVAALADVTVGRGLARAFSDSATFAPVAAIVGDLAGVDEGAPPASIRSRLRELADAVVDASTRDRVVERLSLLFGTAERPASGFVQEVHTGVVELIDTLARDRTFALVFEDAHWLKPAMLDLIERLGSAPRTGRRRAMILVLARPELLELRPTWASNTANAVTIHLDPLSLDESIDLAQQAAAGRLDDEQATQIAVRAGGNPFFIVETTGMLIPESGRSPSAAVSIPPTVHAIVSARLDALPPRLRELARHASVFFVSFDIDELRVVDPDATVEEVRRLEEAEIVVREEGHRASPARWRIRHATVKDVAYASLPKRERVRLHRRFADRLLAQGHQSWAADHLYLAGVASLDLDPDDRTVAEHAAEALLAAGDRSRRRMESRSAIDYYERSLALSGQRQRWGVREARALAGMSEAHYWLGEYRASTERGEHAVELGTELEDQFTLALALRFLGDIALNVEGDVDKAEDLLDRSLVSAEALGDRWAIVRTLLFAGWVPSTRKEYDRAEEVWRRALEVAHPDDGWARARALNSLAVVTTDLPAALRLSEEATAVAERIGDPFSLAMTSVQRARVLEQLGRFPDALACLEPAIATFEDLGAKWELADATAERGDVRRELGQLDPAEEDLRRALRISEELGERQLGSWLWRSLAKVSEKRGDQRQADDRWRRSREADEWRSRFVRDRAATGR